MVQGECCSPSRPKKSLLFPGVPCPITKGVQGGFPAAGEREPYEVSPRENEAARFQRADAMDGGGRAHKGKHEGWKTTWMSVF